MIYEKMPLKANMYLSATTSFMYLSATQVFGSLEKLFA
jgi:hypothetical protein